MLDCPRHERSADAALSKFGQHTTEDVAALFFGFGRQKDCVCKADDF